jgi:hypothetical protein
VIVWLIAPGGGGVDGGGTGDQADGRRLDGLAILDAKGRVQLELRLVVGQHLNELLARDDTAEGAGLAATELALGVGVLHHGEGLVLERVPVALLEHLVDSRREVAFVQTDGVAVHQL